MKKIIVLTAVLATLVSAAPKCDFEKDMRNFEKRMEYSLKWDKVTRNIASNDDGVSVIQKLSKPMKSGQYMGLRQFEVFGFIGCDLKDVRTGKVSKDGDVVAEATVHLRPDGNLKASCKGSGDVMRANPFTYSMEPNPECVCYDGNSIERKPVKGKWCAEDSDFDGGRTVISPKALDFVDPFEKKVDNSGLSVQVVERDCYFDGPDAAGRTSKKVLAVVGKALKDVAKAVDGVDGDGKDGNATLKLAIAADGSVSSARVVSATIFNNGVKEALSGAVSGLDFGKANGDAVFFLVLKVVK